MSYFVTVHGNGMPDLLVDLPRVPVIDDVLDITVESGRFIRQVILVVFLIYPGRSEASVRVETR